MGRLLGDLALLEHRQADTLVQKGCISLGPRDSERGLVTPGGFGSKRADRYSNVTGENRVGKGAIEDVILVHYALTLAESEGPQKSVARPP